MISGQTGPGQHRDLAKAEQGDYWTRDKLFIVASCPLVDDDWEFCVDDEMTSQFFMS